MTSLWWRMECEIQHTCPMVLLGIESVAELGNDRRGIGPPRNGSLRAEGITTLGEEQDYTSDCCAEDGLP
eukprot:CAMPEP_0115298980 /NCGR_PEP_ID=MMETSP0270-20121206/68544_1 /TAXON_ID=71861 /ORGANISM="Scrippsiella trochoidea, Strain CCMP3099" /LENGTH=69 /DNA_ID=CAMNT_0002716687 /DNA_START=287 /DNA_END=493 /DNA_ORIENTATION=-